MREMVCIIIKELLLELRGDMRASMPMMGRQVLSVSFDSRFASDGEVLGGSRFHRLSVERTHIHTHCC